MSKFGWDLPPGVSLRDIDGGDVDELSIKCIFCGEETEREEGDDGCILVEPCGCKRSLDSLDRREKKRREAKEEHALDMKINEQLGE